MTRTLLLALRRSLLVAAFALLAFAVAAPSWAGSCCKERAKRSSTPAAAVTRHVVAAAERHAPARCGKSDCKCSHESGCRCGVSEAIGCGCGCAHPKQPAGTPSRTQDRQNGERISVTCAAVPQWSAPSETSALELPDPTVFVGGRTLRLHALNQSFLL